LFGGGCVGQDRGRDAGLGRVRRTPLGVMLPDPAGLLAALGDPEAVLLEDGHQGFAILALGVRGKVLARPGGPFHAEGRKGSRVVAATGFSGLREALAWAGSQRTPAFGYVGYPFAARIEELPLRSDARPDVALLVPGLVLRVDLRRGGAAEVLEVGGPPDAELLRQVVRAAQGPLPPVPAAPSHARVHVPDLDRHRQAVEQARRAIWLGEAFQIVVGRPFRITGAGEALAAYRRLRAIRASYGGYVHVGGVHLCSASPELLVARRGRLIRTMPIAGTRPRGLHGQSDRRLRRELLADPKERAEHAMLLDLGRNDLGRVAEWGSVRVGAAFRVYTHPTVLHITSHVHARLRRERDSVDLLAAVFPAGTVSGAPKVRAMELIHELEEDPRGPYAGAFGYLAPQGDVRLAITLRTAVYPAGDGGDAEVWAGGGIVAHSVAERESQEIVAKASTVLAAAWPEAQWSGGAVDWRPSLSVGR
jgi:anthranilate synthase component 1